MCRKIAKANSMIRLTLDILFFAKTLIVAQAENLSTGVMGSVFFIFSISRIGNLILIHIGRVRKQTITKIEEDEREQEQSLESNGDVERN